MKAFFAVLLLVGAATANPVYSATQSEFSKLISNNKDIFTEEGLRGLLDGIANLVKDLGVGAEDLLGGVSGVQERSFESEETVNGFDVLLGQASGALSKLLLSAMGVGGRSFESEETVNEFDVLLGQASGALSKLLLSAMGISGRSSSSDAVPLIDAAITATETETTTTETEAEALATAESDSTTSTASSESVKEQTKVSQFEIAAGLLSSKIAGALLNGVLGLAGRSGSSDAVPLIDAAITATETETTTAETEAEALATAESDSTTSTASSESVKEQTKVSQFEIAAGLLSSKIAGALLNGILGLAGRSGMSDAVSVVA